MGERVDPGDKQGGFMKLCVGFLLVSMLLAFNCHAGETWYTDMNQYACNTRADLRDLLKYPEQNDFEAFQEKIQTNRCFPIGGCMEVQLMQIYKHEDAVKIRKRGDPREMWVPSYSITNTRPPCEEEWKK